MKTVAYTVSRTDPGQTSGDSGRLTQALPGQGVSPLGLKHPRSVVVADGADPMARHGQVSRPPEQLSLTPDTRVARAKKSWSTT